MEFARIDIAKASPKEFQLLVQATEDRMFSLNSLGFAGLGADGCLPEDIRCSDPSDGTVGSSSMPGYYDMLKRAITHSVSRVENKIKLGLFPRVKTDFAKTPREVYEDRYTFGTGNTDSFLNPGSRTYPEWQHLTDEQQAEYQNNQSLYTPGTMPWDLLTREQRDIFSRSVIYYPNKTEDSERIDGRGRSYIKLYERYVTDIYRLELRLQDPQGLGIPYLARSYNPSEYFLYKKSGAVILFPAQARVQAMTTANMIGAAGYGMIVPAMPQILHVSYKFGLETIPHNLQDAVALYAAARMFELVNIAMTKGLTSYSVQGFSASFGDGLYQPVIQRYHQEAEDILHSYYQISMVGW